MYYEAIIIENGTVIYKSHKADLEETCLMAALVAVNINGRKQAEYDWGRLADDLKAYGEVDLDESLTIHIWEEMD